MKSITSFSMSKTLVFLMLFGAIVTANAQFSPTDFDGDGVPNNIDLDDDNDGILDTVESVISYIQLDGFTAFSPATIPSSGLVTGNRLIKVNALTYLNVSYDAVLEFTDVHAVSGRVRLIAGGDIALQDIHANENPYFSYTIKFLPTGTATPTGTLTASTINNLAITLADIDGNGSSSDMGDVAGYAISNTITGAPVVGANLVNAGFTFGTSGIGGPGTMFNYYRPAALTATSGAPNTTIVADPRYMVTTYQNVYTESGFIYGATGTETSEIGERKSQIFIRLGNIDGVDTDGDGIINQYDLDSDNDGCSDSNEYYFNSTSAAPNQQYGMTAGAVAPVNPNGTVIGASYSGFYELALVAGGANAFSAPLSQSISVGANATFSVTAAGNAGISTFTWQVSTDGGTNWTNVTNGGVYSGAATTVLTITAAPYSMNNYKYRLVISSSDYVCGDTFSVAATLTFLNAAPIANDDNQSATPLLSGANGTVNIIANDTDSDGNPTVPVNGIGQFTVDLDTTTPGIQTTITTAEGVWTLDNTTGIVTFAPATNFSGSAALVYQLCDPSGACDTATITFVVNSNSAPIANDDNQSATPLLEDGANGTVNIIANDTDAEGNPTAPVNGVGQFTVDLDATTSGIQTTVTTAEGVWTLNNATGVVTFDPANNYFGTATLTYTLCDSSGACDTAIITFVVSSVNDAPVANNDLIFTPYDTTVAIPVAGNDTDIDGTINTATIDLDPSTPGIQTTFTVAGQGTYTANNDGTVTFDPLPGFEGNATPINYVIQDNNGALSNVATIAVTVGPCSSNPAGDCDQDGLSNATEISLGTDPNDPDTDGDGVLDGTEVADTTNPLDFCESIEEHATIAPSTAFLNGDCDGDGLSNESEFGDIIGYPFDSNGNGIPDYLEFNDHHLSNSDDDLEIFNGVSPTSDDIKNNVFTIRNIEKYPNNTLQIFDRWGVLVYEADGYGTGNKYFKGISEGRGTVSSSSGLPEGTYFYVLKYVNASGKTKDRSGYLYLNR